MSLSYILEQLETNAEEDDEYEPSFRGENEDEDGDFMQEEDEDEEESYEDDEVITEDGIFYETTSNVLQGEELLEAEFFVIND
jgi:hypothetical protein